MNNDHTEQTTSLLLWNDNRDLALASLNCDFVQGLKSGLLPADKFKAYIAQDAYFLDAFARAYALAIAYSPDRNGLYQFLELLNGVVYELKLHQQYADRWKVDLSKTIPGPSTTAYIDFLLDTARSGRVDETCAAMTPCMRLYAFLGQELNKSGGRENNQYADWITTYGDPGFEDLASTLESLLDRYAIDEDSVKRIYRQAMKLELNFFTAHA
jgi:thiaminase (transcriptional activator TenA)